MLARRVFLLTSFCFACSSEEPRDAGTRVDSGRAATADANDVHDAEPIDSGTARDAEAQRDADPIDAGVDAGMNVRDAEPADTGVVAAECTFDQDCPSGQVCKLDVSPHLCVAGRSCMTTTDCNRCSDIASPADCGHGSPFTATCDPAHGNVCVRGRAPCEACTTDADCGRQHPLIGGAQKRCHTYSSGLSFCSRPCGACPNGFVCDANESACLHLEECSGAGAPLCDFVGGPNPQCAATHQICAGQPCSSGGHCATNDQPGEVGVCIAYCTSDADCASPTPICNTRSGICIAGCVMNGCAGGQTCHADGYCRAACASDGDCPSDQYCNIMGGVEPRMFKSHRDELSCAPLGCERGSDCASNNCDTTVSPPACAP